MLNVSKNLGKSISPLVYVRSKMEQLSAVLSKMTWGSLPVNDFISCLGTTTADKHYGVTNIKLYFSSTRESHIDLHTLRTSNEIMGLTYDYGQAKTKNEKIDYRAKLWGIFQRLNFGKAVYDEISICLCGDYTFQPYANNLNCLRLNYCIP